MQDFMGKKIKFEVPKPLALEQFKPHGSIQVLLKNCMKNVHFKIKNLISLVDQKLKKSLFGFKEFSGSIRSSINIVVNNI